MATEHIFKEDSYRRECDATVMRVEGNGVYVDQTVFYPLGGGQPGDTGVISCEAHSSRIVDTRYDEDDEIFHVVEEGDDVPPVGATVKLTIDWDRRHRHMRMHTAMHLLGSILKFDVTGGNISADKSRVDFNMGEGIDKEAVSAELAELVRADHPVSCRWISEDELDANPQLVRTMSVQPPRGRGAIRLLEIESIDLQPCGGTHVKSTSEVGLIRIGKVENKGRQNRRVNIHLDD